MSYRCLCFLGLTEPSQIDHPPQVTRSRAMPGKRKRSANGRGGETGAEILAQKAAPGQVELQNKLYTWVKNNLHEDGASHTILQKLRTGELQKMGLYLLRESECSRTQIVSALQEIEPVGVHATSASAPDSGPHHLLLRLERSWYSSEGRSTTRSGRLSSPTWMRCGLACAMLNPATCVRLGRERRSHGPRRYARQHWGQHASSR